MVDIHQYVFFPLSVSHSFHKSSDSHSLVENSESILIPRFGDLTTVHCVYGTKQMCTCVSVCVCAKVVCKYVLVCVFIISTASKVESRTVMLNSL